MPTSLNEWKAPLPRAEYCVARFAFCNFSVGGDAMTWRHVLSVFLTPSSLGMIPSQVMTLTPDKAPDSSVGLRSFVRVFRIGGGISLCQRSAGKFALRFKGRQGTRSVFRSDSPRQLVAAARTLSSENLRWYRNFSRLFESSEKDLVFDFGANIGYTAQLFLETLGNNKKIVLFEPHLGNLSQLIENFRSNSRVAILPVGIGPDVSIATLAPPSAQLHRQDAASNTGLLSVFGVSKRLIASRYDNGSPLENAVLVNLGSLLSRFEGSGEDSSADELYDRVVFCKVDVEGSEAFAFDFLAQILNRGAIVEIELNRNLESVAIVPSNNLDSLRREASFGVYSRKGEEKEVQDYFLIPSSFEQSSSELIRDLELVRLH